MKKISLILLLLNLICLPQYLSQGSSDEQQTDESKIDYIDLAYRIFQSLERQCFPDINQTINERMKFEKDKKFPWITDSMGKGINDIGDEIECLNSMKNTTFFMVNFYELNLSLILDNDQKLMDFLEISNFTLGFCIFYSCKDAFQRYLQILAEFVNYLASKNPNKGNLVSLIVDNKIDTDEVQGTDTDNYQPNVYNSFDLDTYLAKRVIFWIMIGLAIVKAVGGLLRIIFIPKGYDKYVAEKINQSGQDNNIDDEENSNLTSKHKLNEPLNEESNTKDYNPLFDFSEKLPIGIRILRVFDLINDFHYLSSKRNRYYNDNGLEIITFIRAIVIFFLIFSNTFSALITLPSEEIINSSFFKSWLNIIYRLSNNSLVCWAFLEGAYTTYKLLCFIQAEMFIYYAKGDKRKQKLYKKLPIIYAKFLVLLIPKIVTFILVYMIFYYRIEDYRDFANAKATFHHIITYIFKQKIKCDGLDTIFTNNFSVYIGDYDACYEFTYFYINMVLCILVFMVVTYLFFIIRNKIFEWFIIFGSLILLFLPNFFVKDHRIDKEERLLHYHIKGQTYSTKIFESFVGFYHLGFIIGYILFNFDNLKQRINRLIYEYRKIHIKKLGSKKEDDKSGGSIDEPSSANADTNLSYSLRSGSQGGVSNNEQSDANTIDYYKLPYYPLQFSNTILKPINNLKFSTKIIIILSGVALLIIIDFIILIYLMTSEDFGIVLENWVKTIFKIEKNVFILVLFFMIVIMITLPKKGALRNFMKSKIFICISRIGFLITCVSQVFTYFSFFIFSLKVKLYVPTFMIISFGNFLLFFIICIILCAIFELPLRMIIKKILRIKTKKESIVF